MFHREDRVVLFSGADEPMDSKQALVNTLLSRCVPFVTIGTDTTREAGLPLQLPTSAGLAPRCLPFWPNWPNACTSTPTPRRT
jgi:hypothetical protein